jgi:hypothetical protein
MAAKLGLLHDAHEAYLGDLPAPVKGLEEVRKVWVPIEQRIDDVIFGAFDVDYSSHMSVMVKEADAYALAYEKRWLMAAEPQSWGQLPELSPTEPPLTDIWPPEVAEAKFLELWGCLGERRRLA